MVAIIHTSAHSPVPRSGRLGEQLRWDQPITGQRGSVTYGVIMVILVILVIGLSLRKQASITFAHSLATGLEVKLRSIRHSGPG